MPAAMQPPSGRRPAGQQVDSWLQKSSYPQQGDKVRRYSILLIMDMYLFIFVLKLDQEIGPKIKKILYC